MFKDMDEAVAQYVTPNELVKRVELLEKKVLKIIMKEDPGLKSLSNYELIDYITFHLKEREYQFEQSEMTYCHNILLMIVAQLRERMGLPYLVESKDFLPKSWAGGNE